MNRRGILAGLLGALSAAFPFARKAGASIGTIDTAYGKPRFRISNISFGEPITEHSFIETSVETVTHDFSGLKVYPRKDVFVTVGDMNGQRLSFGLMPNNARNMADNLLTLADEIDANHQTVDSVRPTRQELRFAAETLQPGLRMAMDYPGCVATIVIDYETRSLVVVGRYYERSGILSSDVNVLPDSGLKRELGFCVTGQSILDDTYKAWFAPNLTSLLRLLSAKDLDNGIS